MMSTTCFAIELAALHIFLHSIFLHDSIIFKDERDVEIEFKNPQQKKNSNISLCEESIRAIIHFIILLLYKSSHFAIRLYFLF